MATEQRGTVIGDLTASTDLSTHQYKFVKISGVSTVTVCAAATDTPIGVLQNKPTAGQPAEIMITGKTKMVAGAAITAGDDLTSNASGQAITAVTAAGANRQYGKAVTTAAGANVIVEVLLPGVVSRI